MEKTKRMQFYGGTFGACAPLLLFMCLMIVIAAMKKVSLVLFCMAGFAGLCAAFLLAKDKKEFEQAVVDGLKNDTLCVIIFAFLLAGILSQELRQSGLIQGLTWLVMKLSLSAGFLPLVAFLVCLLISTACGTSNGAIVAVLPVLLPVAATVGANPSVVVGAIVSGAIFGDNLAPISDTTIASALTQDAEVRDVVRTRLPYSLIAGVISAVLFIIVGIKTSTSVTLPDVIDPSYAIVKAAREINPDIYIVTDAVQHAPHAVLDVDALGIDGATFAPYKFFGTRGMGYGYVSDRVAKLPHRKILQRPADVWELGSPTPGNFAAMSAVVDYVCWIGGHFIDSDDRRTRFVTGMEHIHLQERALLHTMLEGTQNVPGLRHIPGVHVYVDSEDFTHRDLIVAMGIDGIDMTRCVEEYQKRGVTVFERVNSSVYSKRIVEAVGLTGAIRVSPLHCHTVADIETYLRVTQELAQTFAK